MSYEEQLQDERWLDYKKQILKRDNYTCRVCGQDKLALHVHHTYYRANAMAWQYPQHSLITLCERCHFEQHTQRGIELGPRRIKTIGEAMRIWLQEIITRSKNG